MLRISLVEGQTKNVTVSVEHIKSGQRYQMLRLIMQVKVKGVKEHLQIDKNIVENCKQLFYYKSIELFRKAANNAIMISTGDKR